MEQILISYFNSFDLKIAYIPYRPKKGQPKVSSAQIFVILGKFRQLEPTNNLDRRKFGLFLKYHIGVKFVLVKLILLQVRFPSMQLP